MNLEELLGEPDQTRKVGKWEIKLWWVGQYVVLKETFKGVKTVRVTDVVNGKFVEVEEFIEVMKNGSGIDR